MITIKLPAVLRKYTNGESRVSVNAETVDQALQALVQEKNSLQGRLLDEQGNIRSFVNVFLDSKNIKDLQGMKTSVSSGQTISIVPPFAGG